MRLFKKMSGSLQDHMEKAFRLSSGKMLQFGEGLSEASQLKSCTCCSCLLVMIFWVGYSGAFVWFLTKDRSILPHCCAEDHGSCLDKVIFCRFQSRLKIYQTHFHDQFDTDNAKVEDFKRGELGWSLDVCKTCMLHEWLGYFTVRLQVGYTYDDRPW